MRNKSKTRIIFTLATMASASFMVACASQTVQGRAEAEPHSDKAQAKMVSPEEKERSAQVEPIEIKETRLEVSDMPSSKNAFRNYWILNTTPIFDINDKKVGELDKGKIVRVFHMGEERAFISEDRTQWVRRLSLTTRHPDMKRAAETATTGQERIDKDALIEQLKSGQRQQNPDKN